MKERKKERKKGQAKGKYKDGCLVVFYCVSTIVGYLMPNYVYTYDFQVNS